MTTVGNTVYCDNRVSSTDGSGQDAGMLRQAAGDRVTGSGQAATGQAGGSNPRTTAYLYQQQHRSSRAPLANLLLD